MLLLLLVIVSLYLIIYYSYHFGYSDGWQKGLEDKKETNIFSEEKKCAHNGDKIGGSDCPTICCKCGKKLFFAGK